jgi:uncharacterized SAM-binding protein YcdF (DUF218 family)
MFIFRQIVGFAGMPLTVALLVVILAALAKGFRRGRLAVWLLVLSGVIAYLSSIDVVGDALLAPLENQYPAQTRNDRLPEVSYVVVLGAGYSPRTGVPVTGALDEDGLARVIEGIRLFRGLTDAKLIVSGGPHGEPSAPALGYAIMARELGVPEPSLIVMTGSLNTEAEARAVTARIGAAPFLLVTSASHMPRSMKLMMRAGARPIAAPTAQRQGGKSIDLRRVLPSAKALRNSERALHEYIGLGALALGLD